VSRVPWEVWSTCLPRLTYLTKLPNLRVNVNVSIRLVKYQRYNSQITSSNYMFELQVTNYKFELQVRVTSYKLQVRVTSYKSQV
jgi:hypothetical protein